MSNDKVLQGNMLMKEALRISMPQDEEVKNLQDNLLIYSTVIANMKYQLNKVTKENETFRKTILAIQANSVFELKDEALGAYEYLNDHTKEMNQLLHLFKLNGDLVNIDFVIQYNEALQSGIDLLIQLISRTLQHDDFDLIS